MPKRNANWSIADSDRLYKISSWGSGYYQVNDQGHLSVCPQGNRRRQIDLLLLMDELRKRNIQPPVLIRFMDILRDRVRTLHKCFQNACRQFKYEGDYHPVYPIKVNQQRQVVEAMIQAGRRANLGLEVGSKPEQLAVLALSPDYQSLIICNGYKDEEFIETALYARRLGKNIILVVEKLNELEKIIQVAQRVKVKPAIGVRIKLAHRGSGKWGDSAGDRSKFGLRVSELLTAVRRLEAVSMLDAFQLIHVHIGSQISQIEEIKGAMTEVSRFYSELRKLGIDIKYVDVGGGLGIDYDGSSSNNTFSVNYSPQEYANDIVFAIKTMCDREKLPHPDIITESGRALTAHYSVLIANVIDQSTPKVDEVESSANGAPQQLLEMRSIYREISPDNCREYYHDACYLRKESLNLFNIGYMSLEHRSQLEELFWAIMTRISQMARELNLNYEEFAGLDALLSSFYFVNFSLFQSLPDCWAIDQLFPIVPIHRLDERPDVKCTLADITCDSDGQIGRFIGGDGVEEMLPLHRLRKSEDYYLGFFLVGAYQEILGDLHNLFGDSNAVHIVMDKKGHHIDHVITGDTVTEVLSYLQYSPRELIDRLRGKLEDAVDDGKISVEDSTHFLKLFETGLAGYTYLED